MCIEPVPGWEPLSAVLAVVDPGAGEVDVLYVLPHVAHVV